MAKHNGLGMVKETCIGQSAAKLRLGERSTTNRYPRCRPQVGSESFKSKWEASRTEEDIVWSALETCSGQQPLSSGCTVGMN